MNDLKSRNLSQARKIFPNGELRVHSPMVVDFAEASNLLQFLAIFLPGKSDATFLADLTDLRSTFTRAVRSKQESTKMEFYKVNFTKFLTKRAIAVLLSGH